MAYHSSVGCDLGGDQPTGYATPSACFHTPEITITLIFEALFSIALVTSLFYVAFFVKLEAEVTPYEATPFGSRDYYYSVTLPGQADTIWAAGPSGKVIRSDDQGDSWVIQTVPVKKHIQSLAAWSNQSAIAVGDQGLVMLTNNGGQSWQTIDIPVRDFGDQLFNVITAGDKEAWIVGRMGTVFHSVDAGANWKMIHEEEDLAWNAIERASDGKLWVAGEFGRIKFLDENGEWQEVDTGIEESLMDITFADAMNGVAVGLAGTLLTTNDGGATWNTTLLDTDSHILSVLWNGSQFHAVGNGGLLFSSDASGQHWKTSVLGDQAGWYTGLANQGSTLYLTGSNVAKLEQGKPLQVLKDKSAG